MPARDRRHVRGTLEALSTWTELRVTPRAPAFLGGRALPPPARGPRGAARRGGGVCGEPLVPGCQVAGGASPRALGGDLVTRA